MAEDRHVSARGSLASDLVVSPVGVDGAAGTGRPSSGESDDAPGVLGTLLAYPEDRSPNYFAQHFRVAAHVQSPRPGAMVAVAATTADGRQCLILARVTNVWEVNPHEDASSSTLRDVLPFRTEYAPEGSSTVIYRVAELEPLEEALLDEHGAVVSIGDVQTLPRAGAPVLAAA